MTISIEHFNSLDKTEQHKIVWEGACIGYREEGEYKIIIYKIVDFYVELYYDGMDNVLKNINAIQTLQEDIIHKINPAMLYE